MSRLVKSWRGAKSHAGRPFWGIVSAAGREFPDPGNRLESRRDLRIGFCKVIFPSIRNGSLKETQSPRCLPKWHSAGSAGIDKRPHKFPALIAATVREHEDDDEEFQNTWDGPAADGLAGDRQRLPDELFEFAAVDRFRR